MKVFVVITVLAMVGAVNADGSAKWAFGNCNGGQIVNDHVYEQDFGSCFRLYGADGVLTDGSVQLKDCDAESITMDYFSDDVCKGDVEEVRVINVTCGDPGIVRIDASVTEYVCETTTTSMSPGTIIAISVLSVLILGALVWLCWPSGRSRRAFLP